MRLNELRDILARIGKPGQVVSMPAGESVLLLPHGGRVLGLFGPAGGQNFYWTNPALESVEAATAFYSNGDWQNSGGDRTWLAPEVELFFPRYPDIDLSTYFQPRQLDPGSYRVETIDGSARMINRLQVKLHRSRLMAEAEIQKWVTPAANPLRYEAGVELADVEFAGYTQHTSLELAAGREARLGLWNLIQMPHRGEMIVPVYSRSETRIYFGTIPEGDLRVDEQTIRWQMRAQGEQKLGVRAVATTGRVGYRYGDGRRTTLIVRNFAVNPSGEYVDVPWAEPENLGFAVQACNVDSRWGSFSELEYHVPAIGGGTGRSRCEDVSEVWAFRGGAEAIRRIEGILLTSES